MSDDDESLVSASSRERQTPLGLVMDEDDADDSAVPVSLFKDFYPSAQFLMWTSQLLIFFSLVDGL